MVAYVSGKVKVRDIVHRLLDEDGVVTLDRLKFCCYVAKPQPLGWKWGWEEYVPSLVVQGSLVWDKDHNGYIVKKKKAEVLTNDLA